MIVSQNSKDVIKIFHNIKDIPISSNSDDGKLNIFMCPINARNFDYNQISLVLVDSVIDYALSKKNIAKYQNKPGRLSQIARSKFKEYLKNKGELGELLLYCFLEGHLNAPKILTKMEMKTTSSMYVNGSDGVHLLNNYDGTYKLIFGESKLYKKLSDALNDAFKSINSFINEINSNGKNKSGINYEKDLISSNIENCELSDEDKNILELIIYPTKNEKNLRIDDAFSIFIGYEIDISEETKNCTSNNFFEEVKKKILSDLNEYENKIYRKINDNNLLGHTFFVYIIPFTDIDNTRNKILEDILT
ncbi:HamA C-terminal domain-containing protein [Facklamia sp. P12932]|uniref:HamA C-terminal domain-containing protein n=1 Tax=Facklamia sp. P12932 TaxID=3421947 RepID=UPI003D16FE1F